jgi:hypothetical protein
VITFTAEQIDRAVAILAHLPDAAQKAMARAMNRAIEGAKTTAAKQIRTRYRVSSERIKETMELEKATPTKLSAQVKSSSRRPTLYQFGPTPDQPGTGGRFPGIGMTRPPLRVAALRKRAPVPIRRAFVLRSKEGNMLIGFRVKGTRMKSNPKKEKIQTLYGPAVPQMMGTKTISGAIEARAQEVLDKRLEHEISWALGQAAAKGGR